MTPHVDRQRVPRRKQDRTALYTQGLWPQLIRDLVLVAVSGLVLIAVLGTAAQSDKIQQGRRIGSRFTCAALSAVSLAGEQVIASSANAPESPLTRFLEQHGYPLPKVREQQAQQAALAYQQTINSRIIATVGPKAKGLVRPDGTFDCKGLAALTIGTK